VGKTKLGSLRRYFSFVFCFALIVYYTWLLPQAKKKRYLGYAGRSVCPVMIAKGPRVPSQ
jgi:hypothetical protein